MPKKAKPEIVRVRNVAPFTQAVYLELEASVVVEPGQEIDVPRPFLDRLTQQNRWEVVGPAEGPADPVAEASEEG